MAKLVWTGALFLFVGCGGPTGEVHHAMTPDEMLAQQEAMAAKDEQKADESGYTDDTEAVDNYEADSDEEKKKQFDDAQTEIELKRAARSAETCGGVVQDGPRGMAKVNLIFTNNGHVKESSIEAPFAETRVGECVLNAMKAVIVPTFAGPDKAVSWEIDVKEVAPEDKKDKKDKKRR